MKKGLNVIKVDLVYQNLSIHVVAIIRYFYCFFFYFWLHIPGYLLQKHGIYATVEKKKTNQTEYSDNVYIIWNQHKVRGSKIWQVATRTLQLSNILAVMEYVLSSMLLKPGLCCLTEGNTRRGQQTRSLLQRPWGVGHQILPLDLLYFSRSVLFLPPTIHKRHLCPLTTRQLFRGTVYGIRSASQSAMRSKHINFSTQNR